ncbi:MAG: TRAP transporter small permease subunit [Burkholderiales bacterium]|nr:MAG: TRAP transporter small permease subunit [Burkholderiales bacterium]
MNSATPPAAGAWRRFTAAYATLLNWLLGLSVAILVFPVSLQIFSRFTDLLPHYIWTEEMARLLFVWMIMIGTMIGLREGTHFIVDVFPSATGRFGAALKLFASLAVLGFALVFAWFGIEFTRFGWNRTSELADLPLWMIHIAWPITGFTWLVFLGEQIADQWRALTGRSA